MTMLKLLMTVPLLAAAPTTIAAMKWDKRVLLVAAPDERNPTLRDQHRIIARWMAGADERDLATVEVVGDKVAGASDAAATLRQRYKLPTGGFSVVLIGKDGGAKLRQTRPISAAVLERTIDAMPMRRNGER
jgi:hypothetical protein